MGVLTQAAQLILSLSILVVMHELGHFIPSKLFKTRVEKFYLFFDPWFSLFKFKKGDTEYGLGWLPLGGYVKISGMIDESLDKEQMKLPPQDWEFRSKPAWQRLIIMLGGVTVNVLLAMAIFSMVLCVWGEEYLPAKNATYGVACDSLAYQMGLKDGDKVLSVDNKPIESIDRVFGDVLINKAKSIQVERDGQKVEISVTDDDLSEMIRGKFHLVQARYPLDVIAVSPSNPAAEAGIQVGDRVVSVANTPTPYRQDVTKVLQNNRNLMVDIGVLRGKDTLMKKLTVSDAGTIGVGINTDVRKYFQTQVIHYSFLESIPAGISKTQETTISYLKQIKVMFTVKGAAKEAGGFLSIGKAYNTSWDWQSFWAFTAFLSIMLAVVNLLPIPALDGGHVVFLIYEIITRRKPHEKVMEYAQYAGMIILLALILFSNGNDIIRLFSK